MSLFLVSESVLGKAHEVCEDYVGVRSEDGYLMFAVADGHGSKDCARSSVGSELAVEAAFGILTKLAEGILHPADESQQTWESELVANGGNARLLRHVATSVVRDWRSSVLEHMHEHPFEEEELGHMSERGRRWAESHDVHLYGTTLLAGLCLPNIIVLLRQGDGSCYGVFEDGSSRSLLDEDERCVANVTTSLCDSDAHRAMCFAVVNRSEYDPIACFLATDGVDKSLAGDAGVADFFRCTALGALEREDANARRNMIRESLEELRNKGAGDDTTMAGYLDLDAVRMSSEALLAQHEAFNREFEERQVQQKVISGARRFEAWKQRESQIESLSEEQERERDFAQAYMENLRRLEELRSEPQPTQSDNQVVLSAPQPKDQDGPHAPTDAHEVVQNVAPSTEDTYEGTIADNPRVAPIASASHDSDGRNTTVQPRVQASKRRASHRKKRIPMWAIVIPLVLCVAALMAAFVIVPRLKQGSGEPSQQSEQTSVQQEQQTGSDVRTSESIDVSEHDLEGIRSCVERVFLDASNENTPGGTGSYGYDSQNDVADSVVNSMVERAKEQSNETVSDALVQKMKEFARECVGNTKADTIIAVLGGDENGSSANATAAVRVRASRVARLSEDARQLDAEQLLDWAISEMRFSGYDESPDAGEIGSSKTAHVKLRLGGADEWTIYEGNNDLDELAEAIATVTGFDEVCDAALVKESQSSDSQGKRNSSSSQGSQSENSEGEGSTNTTESNTPSTGITVAGRI